MYEYSKKTDVYTQHTTKKPDYSFLFLHDLYLHRPALNEYVDSNKKRSPIAG